MIRYFFSCDWGTSSFRLRLIETDSLKVLVEVKNGQGIADTYQAWLQVQQDADRYGYYMKVVKEQLDNLRKHIDLPKDIGQFSEIPIMLSGMASSTIGLLDLPYKELPFGLDGSDLITRVFDGQHSSNPVIIISGAATADDVMRGEETKVVGCGDYLGDTGQPVQLLMPGTHPKHILVEDHEASSFRTYMTGEFFDLLSGQSVLSRSVKSGKDLEDTDCLQHFNEGVLRGAKDNILHASFMVRTRQVLKQIPAEYNYYYLSGLLIGTELKDIDKSKLTYLISSGIHTVLYENACQILGIAIEGLIDADEALIRGQKIILARTL